jgi:hypothetical protein
MKLLILFVALIFSTLAVADGPNVLCTDFVGKSKKITGCSVTDLNFDAVSKDITKKFGAGFSSPRLIGWDDKKSDVFIAVSKRTLIEKICNTDLDKIFKINLKTKVIDLLWDTQDQIGDVLDNINTMTVLKHSMVRNESETHNCDPLMFINSVSRIGSNMGSNYNKLLNENNYLLVPGIGHPTVYFFSSDLKKLIGSFFIYEPYHILIDAGISRRGTLYALLRDIPKQLLCIEEFDIESGSVIRKKCAPKNIELTYLIKGNASFILIREFKVGEKIISVQDWFAGKNVYYDFKPKAFFPQYYFPHMLIESD